MSTEYTACLMFGWRVADLGKVIFDKIKVRRYEEITGLPYDKEIPRVRVEFLGSLHDVQANPHATPRNVMGHWVWNNFVEESFKKPGLEVVSTCSVLTEGEVFIGQKLKEAYLRGIPEAVDTPYPSAMDGPLMSALMKLAAPDYHIPLPQLYLFIRTS